MKINQSKDISYNIINSKQILNENFASFNKGYVRHHLDIFLLNKNQILKLHNAKNMKNSNYGPDSNYGTKGC